jgi:hypothetical protein
MRNSTPIRWIEQVEAQQVLAIARFEGNPTPQRSTTPEDAISEMPDRLRSWLTTRHPMGWPIS